MTTSTLFFVVFCLVVVSTRATNAEGPNRYCELARLRPAEFGYPPAECCDDRGKCEKFIGPGETKYGLTNPDPTWPRRLCSCDRKLHQCVMRARSIFTKEWATLQAFRHMKCFRQIPCAGPCARIRSVTIYEFVSFADTIK